MSAEAARAKDLARQPEVKKALARERADDDAEIRLLTDIFDLEAGLRDDAHRAANLVRLRNQLTRCARDADSPADSPERSLARRVLRSVTMGANERVDDPQYLQLLQSIGRGARQP